MDSLKHKKHHRSTSPAAATTTSTTSHRRILSLFTGCFGFSQKNASKKPRKSPSTRNAAFRISKNPKTQRSVNPEPQLQSPRAPTQPPPLAEPVDHARMSQHQVSADKATTQAGVQMDQNRTGDAEPGSVQKVISGSKCRTGSRGPVTGMMVLFVMLAIMLVWGRLCAVVCTSALFYLAPLVNRTVEDEDRMDGEDARGKIDGLDLVKDGYYKKVVLEGFLRRDRRG